MFRPRSDRDPRRGSVTVWLVISLAVIVAIVIFVRVPAFGVAGHDADIAVGQTRSFVPTLAASSETSRRPSGDRSTTQPWIGWADVVESAMRIGTAALSAGLTKAGVTARRIHTVARVHLENVGGSFKLTRIELDTEAQVPGLDERAFREQAEMAKKNCPVSIALTGVEITLNARLVQ